jgi:peptidoglycan/xylan/chitin deacetylase (PgdA/CDA1 family)
MQQVATKFHPVTIDEIEQFLNSGKKLPPSSVAITFDDGYADNYAIVAPILDHFEIRASFYLTESLIGTRIAPWFCRLRHAFAKTNRPEWPSPEGINRSLASHKERNDAFLAACDLCSAMSGTDCSNTVQEIEAVLEIEQLSGDGMMMDWDQAKALRKVGHLVGCHTSTHPNVAHVTGKVARAEISHAKYEIEKKLATPVVHFSYPHPALNPNWTPHTRMLTSEAGYRTAVTTNPGPVRKGDDVLALRRVAAPTSEDEFQWRMERAFLRRSFLA